MVRKFVAGTVIVIVLSGLNICAYADNDIVGDGSGSNVPISQIKEQSFKVVTPEKNLVTSDTNLLLSFTAPEGTRVTVEVYHSTSVKANEENYVLICDPIEVQVGALQRGWAEIQLKKGLNKITFKATNENGLQDVDTRIVRVKDISEIKEMIENLVNTPTTKLLENIVNPEKTP